MQRLEVEPRIVTFTCCRIEKASLIFSNVTRTEKFHYEGNQLIKDPSEVVTDFSSYPLKRMDDPELIDMRISSDRGFILKLGDKSYFTQFHPEAKFLFQRIFSKHLCSSCSRCYARPLDQGGCEKVMDKDFCLSDDKFGTIRKNVSFSKRIERYTFILKGFQTFNTGEPDFIVAKCRYYIEDK